MAPVNLPDADNTDLWPDADVYVSFDAAPVIPAAGAAFGTDWYYVGLLDGDAGFVEKTKWGEDAEHYAWGGLLFRRSRGKFKYTRSFTAFERNYATDRLRWPGSTPTSLVIPQIERVTIAFELVDTVVVGEVYRIISLAKGVEVMPSEDVKENEKDPTKWVFEAIFYPDDTGQFATRQMTPDQIGS